jgi:hypothetical protein
MNEAAYYELQTAWEAARLRRHCCRYHVTRSTLGLLVAALLSACVAMALRGWEQSANGSITAILGKGLALLAVYLSWECAKSACACYSSAIPPELGVFCLRWNEESEGQRPGQSIAILTAEQGTVEELPACDAALWFSRPEQRWTDVYDVSV